MAAPLYFGAKTALALYRLYKIYKKKGQLERLAQFTKHKDQIKGLKVLEGIEKKHGITPKDLSGQFVADFLRFYKPGLKPGKEMGSVISKLLKRRKSGKMVKGKNNPEYEKLSKRLENLAVETSSSNNVRRALRENVANKRIDKILKNASKEKSGGRAARDFRKPTKPQGEAPDISIIDGHLFAGASQAAKDAFAERVIKVGLRKALEEAGLSKFVSRPVSKMSGSPDNIRRVSRILGNAKLKKPYKAKASTVGSPSANVTNVSRTLRQARLNQKPRRTYSTGEKTKMQEILGDIVGSSRGGGATPKGPSSTLRDKIDAAKGKGPKKKGIIRRSGSWMWRNKGKTAIIGGALTGGWQGAKYMAGQSLDEYGYPKAPEPTLDKKIPLPHKSDLQYHQELLDGYLEAARNGFTGTPQDYEDLIKYNELRNRERQDQYK